jgi:ADP-ribose pyrophosphatase YjhB (NUDIX family)
MIKVFIRAIVPKDGHYLLMGDRTKEGAETWDLPGGELRAGVDVKRYLRQLVLETTGYTINNLHFFEITCRVRPRGRSVEPATIIDFVFTSRVEAVELQEPTKDIELLPYERFEWLDSGGHFRENKVMGLLNKFHRKHLREEEEAQKLEEEAAHARDFKG